MQEIIQYMAVHAEISIIPISPGSSMSKEVAAAFTAISRTEGVKATLTALGTQLEGRDLDAVLAAVRAAHDAARSAGVARVISTVRIDERLDKDQKLEDKVRSVERELGS